MKFRSLVSIAHNLATSVSDGASFLFGTIGLDVHSEAAGSSDGVLTIDFLAGKIIAGSPSELLTAVIARSRDVLAELCAKHDADPAAFATLQASYGTDEVYGQHFTVTVADYAGHRSVERYWGISGRRVRRGHRTAASAD